MAATLGVLAPVVALLVAVGLVLLARLPVVALALALALLAGVVLFGLGALAEACGKALLDAGARVVVLDHPDPSILAQKANAFDADVVVGLEVRPDHLVHIAYYATDGFESIGGRRLAELLAEELPAPPDGAAVQGMRLPLLRETRMPTVVCCPGSSHDAVSHAADVADACRRAVERWAAAPVPS